MQIQSFVEQDYYIHHLSVEMIPGAWHQCAELLEAPLAYNNWKLTPQDILTKLHDAKMQLWLVLEAEGTLLAAILTEVTVETVDKICRIVALGGTDMALWMQQANDMINAFAIKQQCNKLEVVGRRGWAKYAKDFGWKEHLITFQKTLENNIH